MATKGKNQNVEVDETDEHGADTGAQDESEQPQNPPPPPTTPPTGGGTVEGPK